MGLEKLRPGSESVPSGRFCGPDLGAARCPPVSLRPFFTGLMARAGHVHGSGGRLCDLANLRGACPDSIAHPSDGQDHSAYIPDDGNYPVTARAVQGVARARSGQAPACPCLLAGVPVEGSGIKRDFRDVRSPGALDLC